MNSDQETTFDSLRLNNVTFTAHVGGDGPRLEAW
jgi:hypothetical protein